MIIRKLFKAESAHIVRNCYSDRCKFSIHGHSGIIEVFLEANKLDNAGMIVDFGILKNEVKDFIDSFDHSYLMWNKESDEYKEFIYDHSDRWIELPMSPSAESISLIMLYVIDLILHNTKLNNDEDSNIKVVSVRYHETATGYAEAFRDDLNMFNDTLQDIVFSEGVADEWKNTTWLDAVENDITFNYDKPMQQIIK
jgi:6-pyruvoyltetrahydropterin/6-carboxytetrahydropterin synthase